MRSSNILAKIRAGQPARLAMLGHVLPPFIAYAADSGYDGIWLDLEHRPMDAREIQALLAFFHLYDIDCLLRPPTREKARLYRYLEDGATGLVVPHVSTPEAARDLVRSVKFPPVGDRGIEGKGLDNDFGLAHTDRADYAEHAARETFLAVQIETPEGLANVEAIAAVPGLDALYIGPADLGLRMAHEPEDARIDIDATMARVATACREHGKAWGLFAGSVDDLRRQRDLGATLLLWGVDVRLLQSGLAHASQQLDDVL